MEIAVLGVRGNVPEAGAFIARAMDLGSRHKSTIQFFRADRVFGAEHLLSAAEKAVRAFADGTNMSKTLGMEMMLYAAAERQTAGALRKMGVFDGIAGMGLVVIGAAEPDDVIRELGLERDDSVLEPEGKDPTIFGIRPAELEVMGGDRVCELVLERVAMSEAWR